MTLKSITAASPARMDGNAIQSLPVGMTSSTPRLSSVSWPGAAASPVAGAAQSSVARRMPMPFGTGLTLFPLDRPGRLRRIVVDDPVDAVHLVDDAGRDPAEEAGVEGVDVGGHSVDAGHRAKRADVI